MKEITELHEKAMDLAEMAFIVKRNNITESEKLFRQAFEFESQAARLMPDDPACALTRAILHRSAATLACDCREYREAERLIGAGLAGHPPEWVAEELRELYEQVRHHLKSRLEAMVESSMESEVIIGQLRYADDVSSKRIIRLIDERGYSRDIIVPPGKMREIVRPLWGEMVTVTGTYHGDEILLTEIKPLAI